MYLETVSRENAMAGRKKAEQNQIGLEESLIQLEQVMETMEASE